jgi:hypothetical protein
MVLHATQHGAARSDDIWPDDADRAHRSGRSPGVPYREQRSTEATARGAIMQIRTDYFDL